MNIQVDSNPVVTVNTNNASVNASRRWDTGPLTLGTHTVTVTWNTANSAGQFINLEGLLTWKNDEIRGVRIIDSSFSGRQMSQMDIECANYLCRAMTQMGGVELVIVNLAINDARWVTPESEYRANAEQIISMMRTDNLYVPVVFVLPFDGADHTRDGLDLYGGVLGNIASNTTGVHFVDLSLDMPKIPDDRSLPVARGLYADPLHMSADGHTEWAGLMQHALMEG
ncbi:SGNH/GDSL hydrolase family protein [Glutamicibacter nicotianae]